MTWFEPILAAAAVLIVDQISKALVLSHSAVRQPVTAHSFLALQLVLNRHWMLASIGGKAALLVLWAAAVAMATLVIHLGMLPSGTLGSVGIGAAVGGATGNLLDQLRRGAVVDFIAIGWWPAFNVADAGIVAGAGLVLLSLR